MICDTCQGTTYPRQCRNDAAKRRAWGAPDICPYGIALNHLPIGDNAPDSSPAMRRRSNDRVREGVVSILCTHGARLGCCKVECRHPAGEGLTVVRAHCTSERCRYYSPALAAVPA